MIEGVFVDYPVSNSGSQVRRFFPEGHIVEIWISKQDGPTGVTSESISILTPDIECCADADNVSVIKFQSWKAVLARLRGPINSTPIPLEDIDNND